MTPLSFATKCLHSGMVIVMLLVMLLPTQAVAASAKDPDDTKGRLDMKRISAPTDDEGGPIWHRIKTFGRWKSRLLRRDGTEIDYWFSLDMDATPERVVYVGYEKGRLVATMHRYVAHGDGAGVIELGRIGANRPSRRTVAVRVPRKWLRRSDYRWSTSSYFRRESGRACRRENACADDAPDDRMLQGHA